jgi:hypothetical protein
MSISTMGLNLSANKEYMYLANCNKEYIYQDDDAWMQIGYVSTISLYCLQNGLSSCIVIHLRSNHIAD